MDGLGLRIVFTIVNFSDWRNPAPELEARSKTLNPDLAFRQEMETI